MEKEKKTFNWKKLIIILVVILIVDLGLQWWAYCKLMRNMMEAEARLGIDSNWISLSAFFKAYYLPFRSPVMLSYALR